jgi:hypothetical protein
MLGSRPPKQDPDSAWVSQWAAASEEVGPDGVADEFDAKIPLPAGVTYNAIVAYVLDAARENPVFDVVAGHLAKHFGLDSREAIKVIDRCMGGVFRAIESRPELCPDLERDPIAWHSFHMTTENREIIRDILSAIESYRP